MEQFLCSNFYLYHNLSVEQLESRSLKITETDPDTNKQVDFVNISYSQEGHVDKRISKNIIKIDFQLLIFSGQCKTDDHLLFFHRDIHRHTCV